MRNRELINRRIEELENLFRNLERIVNTQEPIEVYKENISKGLDKLDEVKGYIEAEPISGRELNR
jgi:hypothetical protein